MKNKNPQIDDYISQSEKFARPILEHLRKLVHDTVPDVEEKMKWGMPYFEHKGVLCGMAAFKHHCTFGFWKESLIPGVAKFKSNKDESMGSLGRIIQLSDLPRDSEIKKFIIEAVKLNEEYCIFMQITWEVDYVAT